LWTFFSDNQHNRRAETINGGGGPVNVQDRRSAGLKTGTVRVTATARIHFGFLDPSGRGGRSFGSLGMSLDRPRTKLVLTRGEALDISGGESERAKHHLARLAADSGLPAEFSLEMVETIPPHAGLGSGTQLALSVGTAFAALTGTQLSPEEIAAKLGRGTRSGIGIGTFQTGGVVLDGGGDGTRPPPILSTLPFPVEWRVLLMLDGTVRGIHGADEISAFDSLPEFPESDIADLCRRTIFRTLPALAERDFAAFSEEIGFLQRRMAGYFAPLQGGPFTSPLVSEALAWLAAQGITGLGQSSWGPTGFALLPSEQQGRAVLEAVAGKAQFAPLSFVLASGRNEGAILERG
jgi:beta-ribofuranosylaminobenzene 5'-phosphate synthase